MHLLRRAMTEYLVAKTLDTETTSDAIQHRLKLIQDAAERLERALGIRVASGRPAAIPPWTISKHLLRAVDRSPAHGGATARGAGRAGLVGDPRQAQLMQTLDAFAGAIRGVQQLSAWSKSAARSAKSIAGARRRLRDRAFEDLVLALMRVWTETLGQDLALAGGLRRGPGRWSPLPDALGHFVAFVQACLSPMGLAQSKRDISDTALRLFRERIRHDRPGNGADPTPALLAAGV
ncbi:MAG: hypothetical protein SFV21_19520 [Rhodospirillaceae bacterium]|nr:hypothetical protein [Rhodospirillaceae bacterium]